MKLLFSYYTHKPGGFCKRLYRLMSALARAENEVFYLTLDKPPVELPVKVLLIPFPVKARSGLLFWGLFTVWLPFSLLITATRLKPQRLVAFGSYYSAAMRPASHFCKVPIILFLRSVSFSIKRVTETPTLLMTIAGFVDRLGLKGTTRIVCMTRAMREEVERFIAVDDTKMYILPNDLPTVAPGSASVPQSTPPLKLLVAGVLNQGKNVSFVIEAVKEFEKTHGSRALRLSIAGDGPLRKSLEAQARGVSSIEFLGWVPELDCRMDAFDLLIHPSLFEGVPNIVMESLAHGLPVLCSDIPEHRELLETHELLFSLTDSSELLTCLSQLAKDPNKLKYLREASQRIALRYRFDWERQASEICLAT